MSIWKLTFAGFVGAVDGQVELSDGTQITVLRPDLTTLVAWQLGCSD